MAPDSANLRRLLGIDASDARWLRRLVLQALRASAAVPVASALALSGCETLSTAGEAPEWSKPSEQAGSKADALISVCENGVPRAQVSAMTLARDVDYLADMFGTDTLSERGARCTNASDRQACEAGLIAARLPTRHLLTTEGDDVRAWPVGSTRALLGTVDTLEEATWIALASDYQILCSSNVTPDEDGFVFTQVTRNDPTCLGNTSDVMLRVQADGVLDELQVLDHREMGCATPGRRPPGFYESQPQRTHSALGAYFARAAQLEAASVPAFAQIAAELSHHRAPAALIAQAERARHDETRHAQVTARLARRFGAEPSAPRITATKLRPLLELALDNAIEGCVFETYAALEAAHQAEAATDCEVRFAMQRIADDEIRHAAFSHALHAFLWTRLRSDERAALQLARTDATTRLRATLSNAEDSAALCVIAGLPTRRTALALHATLQRTLWA